MAVSLQSAYCRPVALDHRHSPSLTFKSFAGPKSGTFRRGPSNVNAEFYSRVNQSISLRYSAKKGSRGRVFMMPIGIPRVPYRTPGEGTWQWVDLWNALYRERVVFIGEHIDEEYSNQVLATMLYLDSIESSKKIYLYINGPGGDLTPSMSIYDTMQSLQSPVATHCVGYAYDMAAYILAAGEKGNRSGMPLCEIALQTPAGVARGQMRFLIISLPPLKMIGILISLFQQSLYLQLLSDMWKRLMMFRTKQMNFSEFGITYLANCQKRQVNLLKGSVRIWCMWHASLHKKLWSMG
ncbi:ATP-dependent Clp protease proteolytic subunit-related protein 2, chloroplastic-like isoform X1 [Zingiber officinale]|uniref:ATP-dependent Clp protease proteolytic subunit-related protein 2, chloroplastic-like isoform X1 n=1 Tax=Zingiber officinale TaxID=94328 RepID=UPI001C4AE46C|nr:ATP-dependent Clp protease proteolytic subunit-related protein 2, chloroplastic-like isoform X1 [Zingiber officinale]